MTWTTLTLQVTTPLFNGGAGAVGDASGYPDDQTGIRVPSIRGAMRFWFRALAGAITGPDLRLLAQRERAVFGEAARGDEGRRSRAASPLQLRIPDPPPVCRDSLPGFVAGTAGKSVLYLLGQGLTEYDNAARATKLTRPFVPVGKGFELKLRLPPDPQHAALALAALWLMCTYGGVGARVRRGFGGLRIVSVSGDLPEPWNDGALLTPDIGFYAERKSLVRSSPVASSVGQLREQGVGQPWQPGTAPFPVLDEGVMDAGCSRDRFDDWESLLAATGDKLRRFRATEAGTRGRVCTPEWTDVIKGSCDHFPVGSLGLPVSYGKDLVVHADEGSEPNVETLRRASPLWLRPVGSAGRKEWRLFSFGFLGEFLPADVGVHVWRDKRQEKEVRVAQADVYDAVRNWIRSPLKLGARTPNWRNSGVSGHR